MEITPKHYAMLESGINAVIARHPNAHAEYTKACLSDMRYRWDVLHASKVVVGEQHNAWAHAGKDEIYIPLRDYCNDDNIDTALRKITGTK